MHRTIGTVFKVLAISIVMMILLDTLFIVVDTITVRNRIESAASIMQDELSRNNCIPDSIAPLFLQQLNTIQRNSNLVKPDEGGESDGMISNIDRDITYNGKTYKAINEANVRNYGQTVELIIQVKLQPQSLIFSKDASRNGGSNLARGKKFEITSTYIYEVPALRYLK